MQGLSHPTRDTCVCTNDPARCCGAETHTLQLPGAGESLSPVTMLPSFRMAAARLNMLPVEAKQIWGTNKHCSLAEDGQRPLMCSRVPANAEEARCAESYSLLLAAAEGDQHSDGCKPS